MITLKTLPSASAQEVYNQVKTHLLSQNECSQNSSGVCCYRFKNLKCAAGILIGDDEYKSEMDGHDGKLTSAWGDLITRGLVPDTHSNLIVALQCVHDKYIVGLWREKLTMIAADYNLVP